MVGLVLQVSAAAAALDSDLLGLGANAKAKHEMVARDYTRGAIGHKLSSQTA